MIWKNVFGSHHPKLGFIEVLRYIGPGFLVTVGFIDPGNWASNMAAGSIYGYSLLWVISLSTIMLMLLQHNAAHLGIVTGLCLSEASAKYLGNRKGRFFLLTAVIATISTALAEILGAAIGLNMLLGLPVFFGSLFSAFFVVYMLLSNSYRMIEKWIIGFVSLIGLSFLFELTLVRMDCGETIKSLIVPSFPSGSIAIIMSVLGAVVMPHNLFLHSEVIQSRQFNIRGEKEIEKQLKYEFMDTFFAMSAGWAINSAMLLVAASVFYSRGIVVTELSQAESSLRPLLGNASALIFSVGLLFAGLSSSITAAMAGGSIFAGMFNEPYDIADSHSRTGIIITVAGALIIIPFLKDAFQGIIWSQIVLSIQLPLTIFSLVYLTSSARVMGKYVNSLWSRIMLWGMAAIVSILNILLFLQFGN